MIESHPQSKNKGQAFAMSFTSELRENLPYIALDLPLSVYTRFRPCYVRHGAHSLA